MTAAGELLPAPYNPLAGAGERERILHPVRFEHGDVMIAPRSEPTPLKLPAIRVYVPEEDQPDGPGYWDVTSRQLRAALDVLLPRIVDRGFGVRIRQFGEPPRVYYSVDLLP